ncbi:MAG TPA: hypothetical protein VEK80_11515 [Kribbellaceae bacterium]|nr:hypothetical protein [Kribbellaceae bacterium]
MAQHLLITSGTVDPARAEEFQVAFRTLAGERLPQLPFVQQGMLVHHGEGRWSVYALVDGALAMRTRPPYDIPMPVQLFRDFGVEPSIEFADVSIVFTPEAARPPASSGPVSQ